MDLLQLRRRQVVALAMERHHLVLEPELLEQPQDILGPGLLEPAFDVREMKGGRAVAKSGRPYQYSLILGCS